ncbi:hypothetical protein GCM10023200_58110 [Actinomycetospora chlora]|uniref:Uncharacterized protein n=1 Tax=Actinomycetospora chlora TaxID=663608 RepID=A0ABP9CKG6_9PSEU
MQDAVEAVDVLAHLVGQAVEVLLVLHVQLDHRRLLRQPLRDALDQRQPPEAGEHDGGAGLLGGLRRVEGDRGVGDDPGDQDPLALEQVAHCLPF